jgi:hypothetical protein
MRAFFLILLGLVGCALLGLGCASSQPSAGACSISAPDWPAVSSEYDRATTLAVLGSLKQVVEQDRAHARTGQREELGQRADQLFRAPASSGTGYIAHGALELALRLRQLDCGVLRGTVKPADSEPRYDAILVDLDAERLALGWTPGSKSEMTATSSGAVQLR